MTAPNTSNPIAVGLAGLAAGHSAQDLLNLLTPEGQQAVIVAALAAHAQKINDLEVLMSQARDAIAELNTETNNLAGRIDALLAREGAFDGEVANELRQVSSRLRGLAADPANPVPADGDDPVARQGAAQSQAEHGAAAQQAQTADGGTDVVNPTPGSE